ncbi:glycosyltransferase family 4 protein [Mucilaginibacter calamicampi]|uniref:Glycosyltransferase family 4 protein n=1 Tax=Mucilaginibacter calamicampi TaxID=1302352 RepID=A0ABW2YYX0_9SPHI
MIKWYQIVLLFFTLFGIELIYFRLAENYNIIDRPNHRSSHTKVTIRGGGVIFTIAILLATILQGFSQIYFVIGLLFISFISFIDDLSPLNNRIRILFHVIAVAFLFYQLNLYSLPFYLILLVFIFVIGTLNAVNFMDGINGITGGYGLVALCTLWFLNTQIAFTTGVYLLAAIVGVLVFCFFNFRKKAKCFAGDVGSMSLAFIILYFVLLAIINTQNIKYIMILFIYGVDAVTTILLRFWRGENIFKAHRSHFYQFLANEKQMPHLMVALIYMIMQALINIILITADISNLLWFILYIVIGVTIFVLLRIKMEGRDRLFKKVDANNN